MDAQKDIEIFDKVTEELTHDFQSNPFQYGNEQPVLNELYHRLRQSIPQVNLPVRFETDYANIEKWRVKNAARIEDSGETYRVRTEVCFIDEGKRVKSPALTGDKKMRFRRFDLAIFSISNELIMQSKKPGPGDFWDINNDISVLCEVKHSRNMVSRFYTKKYGVRDVTSLAEFPGNVHKRVFVFLDWWPKDHRENEKYGSRLKNLKKYLPKKLSNPVEVVYIPRMGKVNREIIVRS